jgi:hypothetical protein
MPPVNAQEESDILKQKKRKIKEYEGPVSNQKHMTVNIPEKKKRKISDYGKNANDNQQSNGKNDTELTEIKYEHGISALRRYNNKTDYRQLNRFICCVCGRFVIRPIAETNQYDLKILIDNRDHLIKDVLYDLPDSFKFEYGDDFSELNGLVLDADGFNVINNKVRFLTQINVL